MESAVAPVCNTFEVPHEEPHDEFEQRSFFMKIRDGLADAFGIIKRDGRIGNASKRNNLWSNITRVFITVLSN